MITSLQTTKKAILGLFIAIFAFTFASPFASATTYYYPAQTQYTNVQIQSLLNQVYALMAQIQAMQGTTNYYSNYTPKKKSYTYNYDSRSYDVEVTTEDVDVESDDTATFIGEVELDDAAYAYVWFEYGTDSDLDEETDSIKMTRDDSFDIEVDDLDEGERYFFRAVAEDPSGDLVYGSIKAFTTDEDWDDDDDDNNDGDLPEAETEDAEDIDDNQAELHGTVRMNDYEDGLAFFVYGEDEDSVEDVEDEDTYSDIDEDGDDLQKVEVYSNLDNTRTFWLSINGLDEDTDYYFAMCVEYEDEDNDDTITCGDVENFTTDED